MAATLRKETTERQCVVYIRPVKCIDVPFDSHVAENSLKPAALRALIKMVKPQTSFYANEILLKM